MTQERKEDIIEFSNAVLAYPETYANLAYYKTCVGTNREVCVIFSSLNVYINISYYR